MEYSEYRFRRIVAEETKPLEQMASYIHQNTDMKLYLFLTLEDYAEFEAMKLIQAFLNRPFTTR